MTQQLSFLNSISQRNSSFYSHWFDGVSIGHSLINIRHKNIYSLFAFRGFLEGEGHTQGRGVNKYQPEGWGQRSSEILWSAPAVPARPVQITRWVTSGKGSQLSDLGGWIWLSYLVWAPGGSTTRVFLCPGHGADAAAVRVQMRSSAPSS